MFFSKFFSEVSTNLLVIGPGSISDTKMPVPRSSSRMRVGQRLDRELRSIVGAAPFERHEAQHRGALHDAAAAIGAHQRQAVAGQLVPAEDVAGELRFQNLARQVLHRTRLAKGAIVEQRIELAAGALRHLGRAGGDRGGIGIVEEDGLDAFRLQPCEVFGLRAVANTRQPRCFMPSAQVQPMPVEQPVMRMLRVIVVAL